MKRVKNAGKVLEIYDAIDELPVARFHKYNKMLLIDAGVGSDLSSFDRHLERAIMYARSGQGEEVEKELQNLRQNMYFIHTGLSPRHMAFAVLVKSIDGVPCDDISDEGIKRTLEALGGMTEKDMTAELDAVKKKIEGELGVYFPRVFEGAEIKEYYDLLRSRTLSILHAIADDKHDSDTDTEIEKKTRDLLTFFKPQDFGGVNSVEIKQDKQFESMCLVISKNLHVDAKKLTVLEYYNAFEFMKEEAKQANRRQKRQN